MRRPMDFWKGMVSSSFCETCWPCLLPKYCISERIFSRPPPPLMLSVFLWPNTARQIHDTTESGLCISQLLLPTSLLPGHPTGYRIVFLLVLFSPPITLSSLPAYLSILHPSVLLLTPPPLTSPTGVRPTPHLDRLPHVRPLRLLLPRPIHPPARLPGRQQAVLAGRGQCDQSDHGRDCGGVVWEYWDQLSLLSFGVVL